MKENKLLVSIIVRTKDRPKLLKRALQSIASQTYRQIEVVLVNDGGCDLDIEGLKAMLGAVPLNYVRLAKNGGRAFAGNEGLRNAKGSYIGFLDDDDEFLPEHVSTIVHLLQRLDYKVAYTDSLMVYKNVSDQMLELVEVGRDLLFSRDFDYDFLVFENYIPFMCLLFDRAALLNSGGFDETLPIYEDWDLLIKIGEKTPFFHIKKITAHYALWDANLQISQRNKDYRFIEESYMKIISKHKDKFNEKRIRSYISKFVIERETLKKVNAEKVFLENAAEEQKKGISDNALRIRDLERALCEKELQLKALEDAAEVNRSYMTTMRSALDERQAHIKALDDAAEVNRSYMTTMRSALDERQAHIKALDDAAVANCSQIEAMQRAADERQAHIMALEDAAEANRSQIEAMQMALDGKESQLRELDSAAAVNRSYIEKIELVLNEKEAQIRNLDEAVAVNRAYVVNMELALNEKDVKIRSLNEAAAVNNSYIADMDSALDEKEEQIRTLKEVQARTPDVTAAANRFYIEHMESALKEKETTLRAIYNSHGWKALLKYYRLRDWVFPPDSIRKVIIKMVLSIFINPRGFMKSLSIENIKMFFRYRTLDPSALESKTRRKASSQYEPARASAGPELAGAPDPAGARSAADGYTDLLREIETYNPHREDNRILVIDWIVPTFDRDSGSLRIYSMLKILAGLGYKVTLLPDDLQKKEPYTSKLQKIGIEVLYGNLDVEKYLEKNGHLYAFVILSRAEQAFKYMSLVRAYALYSCIIYDTVDLHWVRFERGAALTDDESLRTKAAYYKAIELLSASCSDIILTVTEDEKGILLKENPSLVVDVIPNIHEVSEGTVLFSARRDLLFIGGYTHAPNQDAVFYFVEEIFPLIKKRFPEMKFIVVGSDPPADILNLRSADIEVTGYVKDITPYFERARVFVSPLRYGAGMKGKIGQSMSYGLPVVTTDVGAEGMELRDGENVLIAADGPAAFAEAVMRLYTDEVLWNNISSESRNHIEKNYSVDVVSKKIARLFADIREGKTAVAYDRR